MDLETAVRRAVERQPLQQIAAEYRATLLEGLGIRPEDAGADMMARETHEFVARVCRALGEGHGGDVRIGGAIADWARRVDDYAVYDALLSHFEDFTGREALLRRGRILFPRVMTDHWGDDP